MRDLESVCWSELFPTSINIRYSYWRQVVFFGAYLFAIPVHENGKVAYNVISDFTYLINPYVSLCFPCSRYSHVPSLLAIPPIYFVALQGLLGPRRSSFISHSFSLLFRLPNRTAQVPKEMNERRLP